MQLGKWLTAALALAMLPSLAPDAQAALGGDKNKGKAIYMMKGQSGKACMTCHPIGLTTGEVIRGKKVPNLIESASKISEKKLIAKALKHLEEDAELQLSDNQFMDLVTFVSSLPSDGFGDVPAEWQGYVKEKARK